MVPEHKVVADAKQRIAGVQYRDHDVRWCIPGTQPLGIAGLRNVSWYIGTIFMAGLGVVVFLVIRTRERPEEDVIS